MNLPLASTALLWLAFPVLSQTVTMSVCERLPGFVRAEHIGAAAPVQEAIAANRCFPAGEVFYVQSGVANGSIGFFPGAQGHALSLQVQAAANANTMLSPAGASVAASADFVLQLSATQPVRGILAIRIQSVPSGGAVGVGNFAVDIDDDGSVELRGDPALPPPFLVGAEFARSFGPGVLPIHVTHTGGLDVPAWFLGEYSCDLIVRWIPDTGPVTSYGQGCGLMLREERQPNGDFGFFSGWNGTPGPNTWLLFGFAERNVVLPLPPGCTQLTDMDAVLPFTPPGAIVPWLPLPVGFLMHVQAVEFASLQSTLTSNGLRLTVGT